MVYFKLFRITGVANAVIYDEGLSSTQENPKRLLSVVVQVTGYAGNDVQGWFEREKIFDIPDKCVDTDVSAGSTNVQTSFNRLNEIEVGLDMPVGSTFKTAIRCGATNKDLIGAYRYELVGA